MESDALRSVRNFFYLGFYQNALNDSKGLLNNSNPEVAKWANVYYFRSLAALKPSEAIAAIDNSQSSSLLAVRSYATYLSSTDPQARSLVIDQVREWVNNEMLRNDKMIQIVWAYINIHEQDYKEALKHLINDNEHLEKMSLAISIYLLINRNDLAAKLLKSMSDLDDDDTLTTLASAWVNIAQGGSSIGDGIAGLQELVDKFGPSVSVLNSLAVCEMQQKNFTQAFAYLKQAREWCVGNNTPLSSETLINVIICLQQLRKPAEIVAKIEADLLANYPNHPYFTKKKEQEDLFKKQANNYKFKP